MDDIQPKKSLGQHWLNDKSVLVAICEAADLNSSDHVLEIGPGMGSLTEILLEQSAKVYAVEFDPEAFAYLKKRFGKKTDRLEIEQGDIRSFDLRRMPPQYKIVANIPYYLTSHLIQIMSESVHPPDLAVLLIQKEVARRVCAQPGNMSLLSITAQYYWETSLDIEVPAALFTPPPKVDSQVIVLRRRQNPLFIVDEKLFFRVVKAGFAAKRKTLINSLSGGLRIEKNQVLDSLLLPSNIDPQKRPQELSLEDWFHIYELAVSAQMIR